MPLIKNGTFVEDHFQAVADDAPLPENGRLVSLARFRKDRESLLARTAGRAAAVFRIAGGFGR
jgi:hypothetical protein